MRKKKCFTHLIYHQLNILSIELQYHPDGIQSMINKISFEYKRGDNLEAIYRNNEKLMKYKDIGNFEDIIFKLKNYIDF